MFCEPVQHVNKILNSEVHWMVVLVLYYKPTRYVLNENLSKCSYNCSTTMWIVSGHCFSAPETIDDKLEPGIW